MSSSVHFNIQPMVRLSVNLNKIALIRNSRGSDYPNLVKVARDCEAFGAQGITIHPRPDQRHARYDDVMALRETCTTELNIEGYPTAKFNEIVLAAKPEQVTLVPDEPGQLTSDHGWDTVGKADYLKEVIATFKAAGIRTSLFVDPDEEMLEGALATGTDRIEFYTGPFANAYAKDRETAMIPFTKACRFAQGLGLGINAGHDLNLDNLTFFVSRMPGLQEVSIGHALVSDALYFGLSNTIQMYLRCLHNAETTVGTLR
jgi:pyridoxine 5-phosphate synthase